MHDSSEVLTIFLRMLTDLSRSLGALKIPPLACEGVQQEKNGLNTPNPYTFLNQEQLSIYF